MLIQPHGALLRVMLVPGERLAQQMRRMATGPAGAFEIVAQLRPVIRMAALLDHLHRALARCQAAQVGQAPFGDQHVHIMFAVIHMRDHGHHAGNGTVLGHRLRHEDR